MRRTMYGTYSFDIIVTASSSPRPAQACASSSSPPWPPAKISSFARHFLRRGLGGKLESMFHRSSNETKSSEIKGKIETDREQAVVERSRRKWEEVDRREKRWEEMKILEIIFEHWRSTW